MNKSGSTFILPVQCNVNIDRVDKVIFTLRGLEDVVLEYPDDVTYEDGLFSVPLTQQNTKKLAGDRGHTVLIEGQINYEDLSVAKTETSSTFFSGTLATEIVTGNTPSAYSLDEVHIKVTKDILEFIEVKQQGLQNH